MKMKGKEKNIIKKSGNEVKKAIVKRTHKNITKDIKNKQKQKGIPKQPSIKSESESN